MGVEQYKQVSMLGAEPKELSVRVLRSIELYLHEMQDVTLPWESRCESGINAITLIDAMSNNLRDDLPREEAIILIKVCGQLIRSINKCIRGEQTDLIKELSGLRLIRKLIS